MKKVHRLLLLSIVTSVYSCSSCDLEGPRTENRGYASRDYEIPACAADNTPDQVAIYNDSLLYHYFPGSENCNWDIDFTSQVLLKYETEAICSARFIRSVRKGAQAGVYIYEKTTEQCGNCKVALSDEGWIIAEIQDQVREFDFREVK